MEDGTVIKAVAGVLQEIGGGGRGLVEIQFDLNITVVGLKNNHNSRYSSVLLNGQSRYNNDFMSFEKADSPL